MLSDVRVVDLSTDVAGAYAAKLFASLGADVVKVEAAGGDPTRRLATIEPGNPDASILFAYLNTAKRSVVLDAGTMDGADRINALVRGADIVIESGAPGEWVLQGIDFEGHRAEKSSLVVCSITPFGQNGPRAHWRTTALTALASGGQLMLTGEPELEPLKTAGHQAYYQAGLHAFSSSMTALFAARRTGIGDHIDISIQEAQVASLEAAGPAALVRGADAERAGNQARAIWGIYECADGYVGLASMARQTPSVYECIGHPELIGDPGFANLLLYPENNDFIAALIGEWVALRTAREIYTESDAYRAPFAMIPTPRDLLEWEPLVAAGFWREVEHPVLGRHALPALSFAIDGHRGINKRAPLLGEHTDEVVAELTKPSPRPARTQTPGPPKPLLDGIRVLDLTQVWAGPYGARFLADMGADVVHIEGPTFPDAVRGAARPDDPRAFDKSSYFNEYNRNKRGLALDLQHPDGIGAFRRMVANVDVVMENWSVGVAEGLGIGYADLRAINPRIVLAQMPAFSREGSEASRVGFGPSIEQMGGIVALQGYEGGPPHKSGISYGDPVGGIAAAGAIALALWRRETTGEGSHIVVYQRDNVIGLVGEYMLAESIGRPLPVRISNRDFDFAPHNVYRARDDSGRGQLNLQGETIAEYNDTWVAVSVDSDEAWRRLCAVVGNPRLQDRRWLSVEGRRTSEPEINEILAAWVRPQESNACALVLQEAGVSACPVLSPLMLVNDEHLNWREYYPTVTHPAVGEHLSTRPVWRLSERPFAGHRPAPCFGEHNSEVLRAFAGLTDTEIERLAEQRVIADTPR